MARSNTRFLGQAFLALVLFIGGLVLLIAVTLAVLANSSVDASYGYQASARAEAVATSGAEDGLLHLERNISFATSSYSLAVGSSTATVSVTQNSPSAGFVTILSVATVSNHTRKINVVLAASATTTQMNVISWQEIQ